jgi:hypothetical protein
MPPSQGVMHAAATALLQQPCCNSLVWPYFTTALWPHTYWPRSSPRCFSSHRRESAASPCPFCRTNPHMAKVVYAPCHAAIIRAKSDTANETKEKNTKGKSRQHQNRKHAWEGQRKGDGGMREALLQRLECNSSQYTSRQRFPFG